MELGTEGMGIEKGKGRERNSEDKESLRWERKIIGKRGKGEVTF